MARSKALPPLAPLARAGTVAKMDRRSSEARLIRKTELALLGQLGRPPSATEAMRIEKVAKLNMRFEVLHQDYMATGESSAHKDKMLLGLVTVIDRLLEKLGLDHVKPEPLTLHQYLELKAERAA